MSAASSSNSSSDVLSESEAAASKTPAVTPAAPPAGIATAAGRHKAGAILRVFRHRNYRLFFAGQLVSLMGTWMQSVAQGWLVYDLTGSALLLGITAFAGQIPMFFGSPFGGAIADRLDKRSVLLFTQGASMALAVVLAVLTLVHVVTVFDVIVLSLLLGLVNAVDVPTRQAFTIDMVGREDLRSAIALNSIMFNIARVVGPSAAGLLIAFTGEGMCFVLNALSYVAVLASLVVMQTEKPKRRPPSTPMQDLKLGFAYVRRHPQIRTTLLLLAGAAFFGGPYLSLMPVFARDVLHQGSDGFGYLMAAIGVGAVIGAYMLSYIPDRLLAFMPVVATAAFGVGLIVFSLSQTFSLSLLLLIPTAFSLMLLGVATNTLVQHLSDEHMRGRVLSFYSLAFLGMLPWGSLVIGWLSDHTSVQLAVSVGGIACIATAGWAYWTRHLNPKEFAELK